MFSKEKLEEMIVPVLLAAFFIFLFLFTDIKPSDLFAYFQDYSTDQKMLFLVLTVVVGLLYYGFDKGQEFFGLEEGFAERDVAKGAAAVLAAVLLYIPFRLAEAFLPDEAPLGEPVELPAILTELHVMQLVDGYIVIIILLWLGLTVLIYSRIPESWKNHSLKYLFTGKAKLSVKFRQIMVAAMIVFFLGIILLTLAIILYARYLEPL